MPLAVPMTLVQRCFSALVPSWVSTEMNQSWGQGNMGLRGRPFSSIRFY